MTESADTATHAAGVSRQASASIGWFCLILLLVVGAPQFVCMPVTNDVSYYDIQARTALRGGVLYRDMVEPNLPGVVWIQMLVRSVAGWSTEVLRSFDLVVFLLIAGLFGIGNSCGSESRTVGVWTSLVLVLAYFSVSEWCHVQRDVWLLLPVAVSMLLRHRQVERFARKPVLLSSVSGWGFVEGLCLGAGVWIKPHVVIPVGCVWIASVLRQPFRSVLADLAGLLTGGVLAGLAGIAWLAVSGAWPWFLDMMLHWNPEYVQAGGSLWKGFILRAMLYRLSPFCLVHLLAVPVAAVVILKGGRAGDRRGPLWLPAVLYLSWCAQVVLLQHPYDYVHLPPILLGIVLLVLWLGLDWRQHPGRRLFAYAALCVAVMFSPAKDSHRVRLWTASLRSGSTSELRNKLAQIPYPDWEDLERVGEFLADQNVQDGEVTCWSNDLVHLYRDLDLEPSTRFVYADTHLRYFPSRREEIQKALVASKQRYVLTNLMAGGLIADQAKAIGPEGQLGFPPGFPEELRREFPWNLPIAFRAGSLVVHRIPDDHVLRFDRTNSGEQVARQPFE